jgi:GTPase Era involved in 16S rRNA processing
MSDVTRGDPHRSGFITFIGRPNVGKSSLINTICGRKISIVSDKPQTTRHRVMGVLTRPDSQLVFVDTPGLHKAVSALGDRVNATALDSTSDVDVCCLVLDATMPFGRGDRWVAELVREQLLAVTHDELPYSIATRVSEWEWPRIQCEIIVERESQKGMVIGKGGSVLKQVGERARAQLPEGVYLELRVKVDKDWQRRPDRVERLGY